MEESISIEKSSWLNFWIAPKYFWILASSNLYNCLLTPISYGQYYTQNQNQIRHMNIYTWYVRIGLEEIYLGQ